MLLKMLSYVSFVPPAGRLISIRTDRPNSFAGGTAAEGFVGCSCTGGADLAEDFPFVLAPLLIILGLEFFAGGGSPCPDRAAKILKRPLCRDPMIALV